MTDRNIAFVSFLLLMSIYIIVGYYGLKFENKAIARNKRKNDHARL